MRVSVCVCACVCCVLSGSVHAEHKESQVLFLFHFLVQGDVIDSTG